MERKISAVVQRISVGLDKSTQEIKVITSKSRSRGKKATSRHRRVKKKGHQSIQTSMRRRTKKKKKKKDRRDIIKTSTRQPLLQKREKLFNSSNPFKKRLKYQHVRKFRHVNQKKTAQMKSRMCPTRQPLKQQQLKLRKGTKCSTCQPSPK